MSALWRLLAVCCIGLATTAGAQESLSTILEREYVAHWLVCGPFTPDVEGGLLAAVKEGRAPLGGEDFMGPRGGVTKVRPQHLDIIETEQGDAVWQRAGASDFTLDLSPFYPSAREGVTYAGFYANSDAARTAYIDLQTPLGARVWLNGYQLRDVRAVPLSAAGRDQFLASFRAGVNFLLVETPGVAFEELSRALGMSERDLSARGLVSRPLLQGRSGFEIALRIRPAQPMGEVAVVPRLAAEGTYSGAASSPRQDFSLTVFNNATQVSPVLGVNVRYPQALQPLYIEIGTVPGKAAKDTRISLPLSALSETEAVTLEVTATDGTQTATFTQAVKRDAGLEQGKVYVLSGPHWSASDAPWPPESAWVEGFTRQALQAGNDAQYGFNAGPEVVWTAALLARPDLLNTLREAVASGQCAAEAAYAACDPRMLSPELLYRNLMLGKLSAGGTLNDAAPAAIAWDTGAISAQMPQLLRVFDLPGLVTDVADGGVAELSRWLGPDGTGAWLRRKEPARGPLGLAELRQMAAMQRRELFARGITTDLLVDQASTIPPEPFLAGQAQELARSVPSILLQGSGAQSFFEDLRANPAEKLDALPRQFWPMDAATPARVRAADSLWLAHARAQALLDGAQRLGAFANVYGGEYPAAALAKAERMLLYVAAHGDATGDALVDVLSETRQAAGLASEARIAAAKYLAGQVDTLKGAPLETEGVRALVVFNPSSWPRTDVVSTELKLSAQGGARLLDDEGNEVPAIYGAPRVLDARSRTLRVTFTAKDVPGIGHRTYYITPAPALPKAEQRPDLLIENEFFELSMDRATGDVERILDKETGESLLSGPANSIALLKEDVSKRKLVDGVWTEGTPERPGNAPEFRTVVLPAMQEVTVRQGFAGGKLTRVVRLYAGVKRVDFETRMEGGATEGMVTASFSLGGPQHATVGGTAFGALVRASSDGALDFKTGAAASLFPAQFWAARAPGEQVQIGTGGGVPFGPTVVVHGDAQPLREAANALAAALAKRGVPVKVLPATITKPDFLWSDSKELESHADAWAHGMRMRIVIGSPEQNTFCSEVVKGQSPETIKWLAERAPQGIVAYVDDTHENAERPVPTFLILGPTANRSAELVPALAREIEARGTFTLAASSFVPREVPTSPQRGAVLLFEGAANVAAERGGPTTIVLSQGGAGGALSARAPVWRYALAPLVGSWTDGEPARQGQAFNAPFAAEDTVLHGGALPGRTAYMSLDAPGAIVTGVHPAGDGEPRDGMVLLAYSPGPRKAEGVLRARAPLLRAAMATFDGLPASALETSNGEMKVALEGFAVQSWWVLPASGGARASALPTAPSPRAAKLAEEGLCKYWLHHRAPPFNEVPALSVDLEGPLDESVASIRLRVGTIGAKTDVQGVVLFTASDGLSLSPSQVYVNLEPGKSVERDIALLWSGPAQPGSGVAAELRLDGQVYRDVLTHQAAPLKVETSRAAGKIVVKLTNPNALAAEGFVDCVVSPEFWEELATGEETRLAPRRQMISIPAYQTAETTFAISPADAAPRLRVKAAANGQVSYADVDAPPLAPPAAAPAPRPASGTVPPPPRAAAPAVVPATQ